MMTEVNYSLYDDFITPMENLLPWLLKILQNRFNWMITDEVYGTPDAPKEGNLLEFAITGDSKQVITPLSIMIECVSELYYGMHDLSLFPNRIELGRQMQIRVNQFVSNKEWNAAKILNFKIKGPMGSICDVEQHSYPIKNEFTTLSRGDTPVFALSDSGH